MTVQIHFVTIRGSAPDLIVLRVVDQPIREILADSVDGLADRLQDVAASLVINAKDLRLRGTQGRHGEIQDYLAFSGPLSRMRCALSATQCLLSHVAVRCDPASDHRRHDLIDHRPGPRSDNSD